jgi:hypothetical protein
MAKMKSYEVSILLDYSENATTATKANIPVNGVLKGLVCVAPDMTQATYTLAVTDKNGGTVFSRASLAKNATTTIWADKYSGTSEYSPLNTPLMGDVTVTITSVGSEGADRTYLVYIYFE